MATPKPTPKEEKPTGFVGKYFNSYTIDGRANVSCNVSFS